MKRKRTRLLAAALMCLVLVGCAQEPKESQGVTPAESEMQETETSGAKGELMMAPDFSVMDSYGMAVKLSQMQGKPVVLNFWASWCGPCKREMPDFEKAYQELGDEIQFMMVNLTNEYYDETKEQAQALLDETGYTFPVYFDTEAEATMTYGVNSVPQTFFINAEGYLVARAEGAIDYALLMQGIDMIR